MCYFWGKASQTGNSRSNTVTLCFFEWPVTENHTFLFQCRLRLCSSRLNSDVITADSSHPNGKVAFAFPHRLLVSLPLVGSAGLGHVGGLLPPQALPKLVHLRGHVLPGTVHKERERERVVGMSRGAATAFIFRDT